MSQDLPTVTAPPPLPAGRLDPAPVPDTLVERPRLHQLLDTGAARPVTLVRAPAGWGKTVLLSAWYRAGRWPGRPVWLTLEPADSADRVCAYLATALEAGPAGAGDPLDRLAGAVARHGEPVVLVLDDADHAGPDLWDGLDRLARHCAGRLRLVLAARTDPALGLHRWRLSGELTELGVAELAFTPQEADRLLAAHGLRLPADRVADLVERAEGWPAGLRLAALALRDRVDPDGYAAGFDGDDPGVADYLRSEVLAGLPAADRDALRRAAVAACLSADLLVALDGPDAEDLLDRAERTGFVLPLGTRPPTWRCHRLLAGLLRSELARLPGSEVRELHRRAADWAAGHDRPADALRHALTADAPALARRILRDHWPDLIPAVATGDPGVPAPPPPEDLGVEPELALAYAADRLRERDPAAVVATLGLIAGRAGAAVRPGAAGRDGAHELPVPVVLAALRLGAAQLAGDPAGVAEEARALLDAAGIAPAGPAGVLPAGSAVPAGPVGPAVLDAAAHGGAHGGPDPAASARALGGTALGAVRFGEGDLAGAEADLAAARTDARRAGLDRAELVATARLALVRAVRGPLRAAEQDARTAVGSTACRDRRTAADCGPAYLAQAVVAAERDRPAEAAAHLALADGARQPGDEPVLAALAELVRARLRAVDGDPVGAFQALQRGREHLAGRPAPLVEPALLAAEADLRSANGDLDTARSLLVGAIEVAGEPAPPLAVALARVHLLAGDPGAAARTLPDWEAPAAAGWPMPVRLAAGLLAALAARAGDGHTGGGRPASGGRAGRIVERVLDLAEPDGYRLVFTHSNPPVRELLAEQRDAGTAHWPMLDELLRGDGHAPAAGPPAAPAALGEPLTERELTVLRYLQSILSNVEIASEMSLSVNTVKTHVRNIYRKLDANRRREAVRRARELHLL
ncbi:LuxR C-terminal-related transcriptional regulator [Plantactinospora sp. KBS50]|uniref:LuxR C-terminal-related transcriptional regulator n=1 Tax=Plantactinospora sp. KBS50 TaxID=2024580 RepID=UPI000BAAC7EF|nr:LuxR C-terminal-related transcriptional regulator [Plantactinospora sp. KBS50]ASW57894.1 hypothetical protein CIK06_21455 [Plantactinospora sp. KBS50]